MKVEKFGKIEMVGDDILITDFVIDVEGAIPPFLEKDVVRVICDHILNEVSWDEHISILSNYFQSQ